MYENANIETIVRGVCVVEGHILLCQGRKSGIAYLPGGHIEFRETARQALVREIAEELGVEASVGRFLGCCEHAFMQAGAPHTEINLVFEMQIAGLRPNRPLASVEDWIDFRWSALAELGGVRAEPAALFAALGQWLRAPGGHIVTGEAWLDPS